MSKYIFITGGVVSSLGKGISGSSIGKLLQLRGFKVNMIKFDPYINIDPGTMNPYQHVKLIIIAYFVYDQNYNWSHHSLHFDAVGQLQCGKMNET